MKMKTKWAVSCASLLAASTCMAQLGYGNPAANEPQGSSHNFKDQDTHMFFHAKDIVGLNVKDSSGEKVGKIRDVIVNPKDGETFAAINIGEDRCALVPAQELNVTPGTGWFERYQVTVNTTKSEIQSGPSVKENDWHALDDPTFTQDIYKRYNLHVPAWNESGTTVMPHTR